MICPHCGNTLDNVIELNQPINQPINQPFNINAAANHTSYYGPIWGTGNTPIINPANLNGAAPVTGTFTFIPNPKK